MTRLDAMKERAENREAACRLRECDEPLCVLARDVLALVEVVEVAKVCAGDVACFSLHAALATLEEPDAK